jgi:tetratricopeptide (TPR) repeat protein
VAYFSDNNTEDAASSFARTIELDSSFAPAYVYLAMAQVDAGRYAQAVKLYDKALSLQEKFAAAHYLVAEALLKLEPPNQAAAEQHLVRALALEPTMEQAHLELGKIYLRSQRVPDAAIELEQVVKGAPELAEAHYQLGRAYQTLKRKDESQVQFAEFERLQKEQRQQNIAERQKLLRQLANVRF